MRISKRTLSIAVSPIRKLTPYAKAAAAKGKKIYHLNIGQPDLPTPETFMKEIDTFKGKTVVYGPSQGNPDLIRAIQKYYQEWQMDYAPDNIYITNGGSEALSFAMMTLCDPGEEILVFEPFYANYSSFANAYNIKLHPVATTPESGYRLPDEAAIEAQITDKVRAVLITNPGNPTGVVLTKDEMDLIAKVALKHDLAIISDEVYREYIFDGEFSSFGAREDVADQVILIDSVSKRYSACGARVGCVITKNKTLCKEFNKCCQSRLCSPEIEQLGAVGLYKTPVSYLTAANDEYKKRCATIARELGQIPGLISSKPQGAFYVMVKLPVDDAEKFAIWLLENFDVNGETVMIAPGNGFYATPGKGVDEARLAYVINCEDLTRAIGLLGEGLKAYPGYTLR